MSATIENKEPIAEEEEKQKIEEEKQKIKEEEQKIKEEDEAMAKRIKDDWKTPGNPGKMFYLSFAILMVFMPVTGLVAIPVLIQMLVYTLCILYPASLLSLRIRQRDYSGESPDVEILGSQEAMLFPLLGSAGLVSLYIAFKFCGDWVNFLMSLYVVLIGCLTLTMTISQVATPFVFSEKLRRKTAFSFKYEFFEGLPDAIDLSHICAFIVSLAICILFLAQKQWMCHNLIGISFSMQGIASVSVGNFTTAFIMLYGLFFYDIFWVFFTDVMVSVATKFDSPAKLIFPVELDPWKTSILGLGDIIIPGFFISLVFRFDWMQYRKRINKPPVYYAEAAPRSSTSLSICEDAKEDEKKGGDDEKKEKKEEKKKEKKEKSAADRLQINIFQGLDLDFPKHYWVPVMISYFVALFSTGVIMLYFKRAQPALLYLVPFTTLTLLGVGYQRGELTDLFEFSEKTEIDEEEEDKKNEEEKKTK